MASTTLPVARSALAGLIFVPALLSAQQQQDSSFQQAGVCSRCHVVQVLEWSASKHTRAGTACQSCHGTSAGHVANERNRSEEHTSELQSRLHLVCRLLLEKKK